MNTGDVITVIGNKEDSIPLCNIKHYAEFCVHGLSTAIFLTELPQDDRLYLVYDPYSKRTYICFSTQIREEIPSTKLTLGTVLKLSEGEFAIVDNSYIAYGELIVAKLQDGVLIGEPKIIDSFSLNEYRFKEHRIPGEVAEKYMAEHEMMQPERQPLIVPKNVGIEITRYKEHFIVVTPKPISKITGLKKRDVVDYKENNFIKEFDSYMNEITQIINDFVLTLPI